MVAVVGSLAVGGQTRHSLRLRRGFPFTWLALEHLSRTSHPTNNPTHETRKPKPKYTKWGKLEKEKEKREEQKERGMQ